MRTFGYLVHNKMKILLEKSFKTTTKITERTALVAESFGLGLDSSREFQVLPELSLDIRPGDICYITGDSGGGKSTLLRMIAESLAKISLFGSVLNLNAIQIDEDEILIEKAGASFDSALCNLSLAGLSDAFLMIRKYSELS